MFHAPCGFGKTTLLTDICHRERGHSVLTAWLSLDETDTLETLAAYIERALRHAGLDVSVPRTQVRRPAETTGLAENTVRDWMVLLMRAMDDYRKSILFALDEVERLVDPKQIRLIDFLVRRAPPNVHFAMTMRHSPPGLDLASEVIDGRGEFYRANDLRFSKPEIALFFDGQLSRPELTEMTERTEGWPAAVRVYRNARREAVLSGETNQGPGSEPVGGYAGMTAKSLSARLRRDLDKNEREYLLDVALLDGIDPNIVTEVLPETHAKVGANVLSRIEGLVRPDDEVTGMLRLHPLVREYCAARRLQLSPARYRMLHGRIATSLARRGHLNSALRHAANSGDHVLVGEILEAAGGVRLWCRYGMDQLLRCDGFLTEEVLEEFPRLVFLRCAALVARADLEQPLALYMALREKTRGFRRDRKGGDDLALWIDSVLVQSTLVIFGCEPLGSEIVKGVLADAERLATDETLDPIVRGLFYTILGVADQQQARFERSQWSGMQAKQCFVLAGAHLGAVFNDFQLGLVAMAEGRVEEAARSYVRRSPALISHVLMAELDLERNRKSHRRLEARVPLRIVERAFDVHAAAYGVVTEAAFERKGAAGALRVLEDSLDFATAERLPGLVRHLSALRVSYLAIGGNVARASRVWREAGFAERDSELLDLDHQSWREMESICCARIRLLEALHEVEAARKLAKSLREVARARGLMRTRMRCIALWMGLEYRSGNVNAAASRLLEFLDLVCVADYTRPLVRESEVSAKLLRRVLGTALPPRLRGVAETVLGFLDEPDSQRATQTPLYTARELEVIERVARGLQDKQIARHLGLTEHGVRYHLKRIFRKIGATSRMDAVQRARNLGIIA